MDKTFVSNFQPRATGRYSRNVSHLEDHFLKKLGKSVKKGIKSFTTEVIVKPVAKKTAKKAGMTTAEAKEYAKRAVADKGVDSVLNTTSKAQMQLMRDAVIAAATLGVGNAVSAAGGVANAANAANAATKGITTAQALKAATTASSLAVALKKKDPKAAAVALSDSGIKFGGADPYLKMVDPYVKMVDNSVPQGVKDQIADKLKAEAEYYRKSSQDVIADNRTSKELLPKNKVLKSAEDIVSYNSGTKKVAPKQSSEIELSITNPFVIGGILVFMTIIIFLALKN